MLEEEASNDSWSLVLIKPGLEFGWTDGLKVKYIVLGSSGVSAYLGRCDFSLYVAL